MGAAILLSGSMILSPLARADLVSSRGHAGWVCEEGGCLWSWELLAWGAGQVMLDVAAPFLWW